MTSSFIQGTSVPLATVATGDVEPKIPAGIEDPWRQAVAGLSGVPLLPAAAAMTSGAVGPKLSPYSGD